MVKIHHSKDHCCFIFRDFVTIRDLIETITMLIGTRNENFNYRRRP